MLQKVTKMSLSKGTVFLFLCSAWAIRFLWETDYIKLCWIFHIAGGEDWVNMYRNVAQFFMWHLCVEYLHKYSLEQVNHVSNNLKVYFKLIGMCCMTVLPSNGSKWMHACVSLYVCVYERKISHGRRESWNLIHEILEEAQIWNVHEGSLTIK